MWGFFEGERVNRALFFHSRSRFASFKIIECWLCHLSGSGFVVKPSTKEQKRKTQKKT